jgi:hypothetical protein
MTTTIHHSLDSRADAGAVKDTDPEVPERTPSASCADYRCRLSSRARCGSTSRVRRQTRRERRLRT